MAESVGTSADASKEDNTLMTPISDLSASEIVGVAANSPPSTPEGRSISNPDGAKANSNNTSPSNHGSNRNAGSKFASLKAAFEHAPSTNGAANGIKRRIGSISRPSGHVEKRREYEAEIARLKEELEKEREVRIVYEQRSSRMEAEIEELNSQLEEREEALREEYERRGTHERAEVQGRLSTSQNDARRHKREASDLQRQLLEMKRSVSSLSKITTQVSDSTFKEEAELLQHEMQNWVVNNFRRVKIEASADQLCEKLEQVTEPEQYQRLEPMYKRFESTVKLPIYQATVACYVMEIFEEPYLFGLHSKVDWSRRARQAGDTLASVFEPVVYNRWRAMTFDNLRQSPKMNDLMESGLHGIAEMISITLQAMTGVEDSEARFSSLKTILKRAVSLAHLIRVQKPQYEFTLAGPSSSYRPDTMDDISDDGDAGISRTIRCTTFPSIVKYGDEEGDNLELSNLIVKAKVLCNGSES